jgi:hypothetical protein
MVRQETGQTMTRIFDRQGAVRLDVGVKKHNQRVAYVRGKLAVLRCVRIAR